MALPIMPRLECVMPTGTEAGRPARAFRERTRVRSKQALDDLARQAQELNMGY